eukprot:3216621-Rhodomonas_salina.1
MYYNTCNSIDKCEVLIHSSNTVSNDPQGHGSFGLGHEGQKDSERHWLSFKIRMAPKQMKEDVKPRAERAAFYQAVGGGGRLGVKLGMMLLYDAMYAMYDATV